MMKPESLAVLMLACLGPGMALAQEADAEIAARVANPWSTLVTVPLQSNYDSGLGPLGKGTRAYTNFQPIVPISLNRDWNLVSRTILPFVSQSNIFPGAGHQSGIADTLQSFFLSRKEPTAGGWIWGAGPALLLPTGSHDLLSYKKWAGGPTAVALKQDGPWTYGMLAYHIWSYASTGPGRPEISQTFAQPFLLYTTRNAWTFGINTETTYDWVGRKLTVPVNVVVQKLVRFAPLPVQFGVGVRYHAISPRNGPDGFGARAVVTVLFAK